MLPLLSRVAVKADVSVFVPENIYRPLLSVFAFCRTDSSNSSNSSAIIFLSDCPSVSLLA